ncbi:MAG TPA: hypothetical protein VMS77_09620 [Conexivisphaerales archaeon]|nr:hypothetical protein [Conexivisphaerales archaeon]
MPTKATKKIKPAKKAAAKPRRTAKATRKTKKPAKKAAEKEPEAIPQELRSTADVAAPQPEPQPAPAAPKEEAPAPAPHEEAPAPQPVAEAQPAPPPPLPVEGQQALLPPVPEVHEALPVAPQRPALPEGPAEEEELESEAAEELPPKKDVPPNHIFIGKKPIMGYALSAVMQLTQYPEVVLRARGKAISRAVDVAEVIMKRLGNGQFVSRYIEIDTDVVGEGAERRNVSTIRISVGKKE